MLNGLIWVCVFILMSVFSATSQNIFPNSEGFGSHSRSAYAGSVTPKIVKVTNLNDSGSGSLRAAISLKEPRIIVFEVAGVIELRSDLLIASPYVIVAGQTAPHPGVTLTHFPLAIGTHDVLVQGLKIRLGHKSGKQKDALNIAGYPQGTYNVVVDHCSITWGMDENVGILEGGTGITISHCIIGEGLKALDHSMGLLAMDTREISVIKNIFIHNADRNPLVRGDSEKALVVNNLIYNSETHAIYFGSTEGLGMPMQIVAINNYYIPGKNNRNEYIISLSPKSHAKNKYFFQGNQTKGVTAFDPWADKLVHNPAAIGIKEMKAPFELPALRLIETSKVMDYLMVNAGAKPSQRDAIDRRLLNDIRNGTGKWIVSPDYQSLEIEARTQKLQIPANPHDDPDGNGFTNVEEWINSLL
jgi:hypothetical protein